MAMGVSCRRLLAELRGHDDVGEPGLVLVGGCRLAAVCAGRFLGKGGATVAGDNGQR